MNLPNQARKSTKSPGKVLADRSVAEIDGDGVPTIRPVPEWLDHPGLGGTLDTPETRWLQAVLRFSRADGSSVFGPIGRSADRLKALEAWADRLGDPSLSAVVDRWRPSRSTTASLPTPPPLPSDSRTDRTLAILRSDWDPKGELVAIDHRQPGDSSLLEVASRGKTWLGPTWTSSTVEGKFTRSKPTHWSSGTFAHCVEWSYKVGRSRVTRVAVLLRGRSMALLGQEVDGPGPINEVRLRLSERGRGARPWKAPRAAAALIGTGPTVGQADPARPPRPCSTHRSRVDRRRRTRRRDSPGHRGPKELAPGPDLLGKNAHDLATADRRLSFEANPRRDSGRRASRLGASRR